MSRSYGRSHDHAWFAITIILASVIWSYRKILPTVEQIFTTLFLIIGTIIIIVCIVWLIKKILRIFKGGQITMKKIDNMSGLEFEKYVAMLLKKQGYANVRLTEKYDLGVDIIAEKDGIRWGIQVKRYSELVKANAVRQVVAALNIYHCDKAMVISNNYYSRVSQKIARLNGCVLIDRDELIKLINAQKHKDISG